MFERGIDSAMRLFARNYVGKIVRGQIVEGVAIETDILMPGDPVRYFAKVFFKSNPAGADTPEGRLLQRVFSEIPGEADVLCSTWRELIGVVSGKQKVQWRLDDEDRS